jgi:hypothetical protein
MSQCSHFAAAALCLGAGVALAGAAQAQSAFVKFGPACGSEANLFFCKTFKPGDAPGSVHDIAVNFPAKGVAMVSFTGSLWCIGKGGTTQNDSVVYRMDMQLRADSLPPDVNSGPGGVGVGASWVSWAMTEYQQTPVTVLRPFNVNAGTTRVFRLMAALRQAQNLGQCNFNGGQMTVTFTPQ